MWILQYQYQYCIRKCQFKCICLPWICLHDLLGNINMKFCFKHWYSSRTFLFMGTKDSQEASPLSSQVIYSSATTSFSNEKISSMKTEPTQPKKKIFMNNREIDPQMDLKSTLKIYLHYWAIGTVFKTVNEGVNKCFYWCYQKLWNWKWDGTRLP